MKPRAAIIMKFHFIYLLLSAICFFHGFETKAQASYKVLFLGNSYTYTNDLPQILHDVALSVGDTLLFDSYAPGGYQLQSHALDVTSQNKIMAGDWNYVVIQGQSQEPITNTGQFFNGGSALSAMVNQYNPCAVTMTYMTWGRKNGDAANCPSFPEMCTYQGMDTTLRKRYQELTANIDGEVSPVSVVWNYIRQNYPGIELYLPDESHPSPAGSYAAACCFYAALFKKDPTLITYDFGLPPADAANIRSAAKFQVFDNLQFWDYKQLPVANIQYVTGAGTNEINFHALAIGIQQTYFWDFGDGNTSSTAYSPHTYLTNGTYTVTLTTTTCDLQGLHTSFADTVIQLCAHTPTVFVSNPWLCETDTLWTQPADSYQWRYYNNPIPETNQYLSNYTQYGISGISVISTVNGCAELSEVFSETPESSGYYFDLIGNPCIGDTVAFAVLHVNGSLSGFENIVWFKNDTLLPLSSNQDTLLITSSGKYECKVINPNATCPLDTTSYSIIYNCNVTGIIENDPEMKWSVYPNPATDIIIVQIARHASHETIQIYNAMGQVIKSETASATLSNLNIGALPKGIYFVRLKNNQLPAIKFIKL